MKESPIIWKPDDHEWTARSHVAEFIKRCGVKSLAELRAASVEDIDWFWREAVDDMGLEWIEPFTRVRDSARGFPHTRWFIDGRINVTHNCIDRHVRGGHGNETALFYESDSGNGSDQVTFAELSSMVDRCAAALLGRGIGPGDCVALYAPMQVRTVVAMFASMKIGALFVPIFCGYGVEALRERLRVCDAKVLFACGTLQRRGKAIDTGGLADAAAGAIPVIRTDTHEWNEFLNGGTRPETPVACASTSAEDPCLILFTSGTTGRPKGTVHTHGGCLAQIGKELRYAFDARPGEPFFWVTDIGWMMGPWELIGCLLYRTPVVLFDGAPNYPDSDRLWRICERRQVVTLGCSPTLIRLLMRAKDGRGPAGYDLAKLRVLGSTGEVWDEASYLWYFENAGQRRCPVLNVSGGTEIVGCHLSPTPLDSLKACSLGGPGLGMDVAVFNDGGQSVAAGTKGHLVCRQPAPSMTRSFLRDDARYLKTYFSRFPDVWYHGDWAMVDEDGEWFLFGRTDDTFKVAGKRVGPGEVEDALTAHPAVSEAAVIGVPDEIKGTELIGFVVLKSADTGGTPAERDLIQQVARQLGKPLAPRRVHVVSALPKTRSGKVVRGQMTRAYLGESVGDISSLDNPEALTSIGVSSS